MLLLQQDASSTMPRPEPPMSLGHRDSRTSPDSSRDAARVGVVARRRVDRRAQRARCRRARCKNARAVSRINCLLVGEGETAVGPSGAVDLLRRAPLRQQAVDRRADLGGLSSARPCRRAARRSSHRASMIEPPSSSKTQPVTRARRLTAEPDDGRRDVLGVLHVEAAVRTSSSCRRRPARSCACARRARVRWR